MARMLFCHRCEALAAVTEAQPKQCATCGTVVEWREVSTEAFTLTHMDRLFLKALRIAAS